MGRQLGVVALALTVAACGARKDGQAVSSPAEIERSAYEAQRAADRGREHALNEQAMRQYPQAGITADMSAGERDAREKAWVERESAEQIKKINDIVDSASRSR